VSSSLLAETLTRKQCAFAFSAFAANKTSTEPVIEHTHIATPAPCQLLGSEQISVDAPSLIQFTKRFFDDARCRPPYDGLTERCGLVFFSPSPHAPRSRQQLTASKGPSLGTSAPLLHSLILTETLANERRHVLARAQQINMPNKKGKRKAKAAAKRQRSAAEINEALQYASMHNIVSSNDANVMSAQAAIAAGANVNYSLNDWSCLMTASFHGHAEMVAMLLNAGADKDVTTGDNSTALMMAAQNGHLECIKYLLEAGCDVHALNKYGASALSIAVTRNHVNCVRALVKAGADITIKVHGETVEDLLKQTDNGDELRAALLSSAARQRICEECEFATRGKMKKCSACKLTHYCSRDCQMANWPLHKQVCKASE
jgi:hypothetical protein